MTSRQRIPVYHQRKHQVFLVSLLLAPIAFSSASAQIAVGMKGGPNISNVSVTENGGPPEVPYDSRTGFLLGATVGTNVTPWLALQLEGRYTEAGTKQTEDGLTASLNLSYLGIPLTARALIPTGESPIKPYLYAGGFAGFEVDCGLSTSGVVSVSVDCETADVGHQTSDFGVLFGGGTDVRLGPGAITIDIEYLLGLRNVAEDQDAGEAYSRAFSVAAGYRLSL